MPIAHPTPAALRDLADWLDAHPLPADCRVLAASITSSRGEPSIQIVCGDPARVPWTDSWRLTTYGHDCAHWEALIEGVRVVWVGPPVPWADARAARLDAAYSTGCSTSGGRP
jgi:hypothetical protein